MLFVLFVFKSIKSLIPKDLNSDYEERLEKSLADEYIIERETGAKLTLEQAESGLWIKHDNELREMPESDIEKFPTDEERVVFRGLNYIKSSKNYIPNKISNKKVSTLEKLEILKKYDDWFYSDSYKLASDDKKQLIIINIDDNGYKEPQLLFSIQLDFDTGHYYFRPKTKTEKILDKIRNDDEIKLKDFECFDYKKSLNTISLIKTIDKIDKKQDIEFEFFNNILYLKNRKLLSVAEVKILETILKNVC